MRKEAIRVDGISLWVESEGEGTPLVLLHGFTGTSRTMRETAERFPGFRTIRLDLLGHGRSDAPGETAPYAMERCASQVAGVINEVCGEPAHVLGYSMGARVALALACFQPASVRSAILVGGRAGFADATERQQRIAADEALADRIERDGIEPFVDRWMALPLFASQARLGEAFLARARRGRLAQRPHGLAGSLRGMGAGAQPPLHDRLTRVKSPVLVAVGSEDERFAPVARDLADRLPQGRLAIVPDAGHAAHLENPEAFARIASAFLADATSLARGDEEAVAS